MKRCIPLIIILSCLALVYLFGLEHYLSFNSLKEHHEAIKTALLGYPYLAPLIFVLFYIIFVGLSIPGAVILSLLGGYLFPEPFSAIYVVIGATCGATLIFLATRLASGVLLKTKVKPFLKKMKDGFKKSQVSYMLFLRLVPIFPFWVINIAPAILGVPTKTFIWTTFVGVIPSSFIFTLAGQGLQKVLDHEKSFSAELLMISEFKISFILLSALILTLLLWKKLDK